MKINKKGFTLVELMVAAAILGGLAMVGMTITKNMQQGQATSETKMEELELRRLIISNLIDKTACINTFTGTNVGGPVSAIKNNTGAVVFQTGNTYGNNSLKIQSMTTQDLGTTYSDGTRKVNLVVNFMKMKSIVTQTVKSANIELRVKAASATAPIQSCFIDEDEIVKNACLSAGGTWFGSSCSYDALYVKKSGDTMTGNLTAPQFNGNISGTTGTFTSRVTSPAYCTGANCKSINDLALSNTACPLGQLQFGVQANGTPNCKAIQCQANYFFAGLDGSGNAICRPYPTNTCPTNQYVSSVNANGTVNCAILPNNANSVCPSGQVLQSINAGVPTCVNNGAGASCSPGQVVTAVNANGSITCGQSSIAGGSCPPGQHVYQVNSNGSVFCAQNSPVSLVGCYERSTGFCNNCGNQLAECGPGEVMIGLRGTTTTTVIHNIKCCRLQ